MGRWVVWPSTRKDPTGIRRSLWRQVLSKGCRKALGVSRQSSYHYRRRPMSPTMMRREWLTALITKVHARSRRMRAELIEGGGIGVSE